MTIRRVILVMKVLSSFMVGCIANIEGFSISELVLALALIIGTDVMLDFLGLERWLLEREEEKRRQELLKEMRGRPSHERQ